MLLVHQILNIFQNYNSVENDDNNNLFEESKEELNLETSGEENNVASENIIEGISIINDTDIKYEYDNNTYMISWNISNPYISSENLYYSISIDGDTPFITDKQSYDISWQNPGDHSFQINTTCKHKNTTELQTYNYSLKDPIDDIKLTLNNKDTPLKNAKFIEYNIQLPSVSNDINYAYDNYKYYFILSRQRIHISMDPLYQ